MSTRPNRSKKNSASCQAPALPKPFGSLREKAERLKDLYAARRPTLLPGPTGCGKTTLIEWLCEDLGLPDAEVATGSRQMSPYDLVGRSYFGNRGEDWVDHALTRAVVEGKVFYFDEIHEVDDDVITLLLPLLDDRRVLVINKKKGIQIKAHPEFMFIGSYNPPARLPAPFRQRCRFLPVEYLPADEEKKLLVARTGVGPNDADFLVRLAQITRTRLQGTVSEGASTRLLLAAAEDLKAGLEREDVARYSVLYPLTDDEQAQTTALQAFQSAGLFSIDELKRLQLEAPSHGELSMTDDDFFDADDEADSKPGVRNSAY